jgi:hypothetical protein
VKLISRLAGASRVMSLGLAAGCVLLGACSQTPVTVTLHSLQASGNLSFVCQADDGSGLKLDECPDYEAERRRTLGLVTQTTTNEVAIVDLRDGAVVDVDPSSPGYTFLRVGAQPGAIVSTPGGVASFVGVTGLEKNGIFALPTTCLNAPKPGEPTRDLTTWAACSLSSAPGDIKLLVDPPTLGDAANPMSRAACGSTVAESAPDQSLHAFCPADLTKEGGPIGRRKLLVALPNEHKLVLLDAQSLLDRPPGEFMACNVEATYPLQARLPTGPVTPVLPDDLQGSASDANTCQTTKYPPATATDPNPGGMALLGNQLYVADHSLPVVHVLDVTDPCLPVEGDPLLPYSYLAPARVVTTSRVAVSPLTPAGKQYVYAIDEADQPTSSIMVFDVSPGVTNRTPIIFPGSPREPFSPPDRLRFSAPVRDVNFVMRDFPAPDPATGVGQFGLACDPNPNTSSLTAAAAQYRPNSDFSLGARPPNLRGVFAFAMLTNGQIPIIDVEDFDAPCRRPIFTNPSAIEDFRGCKSDPTTPPYFTVPDANNMSTPTGVPTVTNESTCNIVEPNRARASALSISNSTVGLRAPTLRALPQFSNPDPAAVIAPGDQPHMLAVDFANEDPAGKPFPAQVNVSGQIYAACANVDNSLPPPCDGSAQPLANDPASAIQNSLTLPLIEPRSYVGDESPSLTFEGRVLPDRSSGFLQQQADGSWWIQDPDASFCSAGVEDSKAILTEGSALGIAPADQPAWGSSHADYVQITGDFLTATDAYWSNGAGKSCGNTTFSSSTGRDACITEFGGIADLTALKNTRELSIVNAFSDHLVVAARNQSTVEDVKCCFPSGTAYTVRASHQWFLTAAAALHDIAAATDGSCVHTAACDLRKKFFHSRAFEVCDSGATPPDGTADADKCVSGAANVGCVRAINGNGPIEPGSEGSQCIFESLTSRFVVYRGAQPSTRDMSFTWSTTGGFSPLAMSLATQSTSVNPQSMVYIPELGFMAVVDGSTLGLSLFDLNSLGVVLPSPYF